MIKFGADVILKSDGAAITDADIDALIKKGTQRANELDARIKADCKHTLANFSVSPGILMPLTLHRFRVSHHITAILLRMPHSHRWITEGTHRSCTNLTVLSTMPRGWPI